MAKKGLKTKKTTAHSQISAHILIKIHNFTSQTRVQCSRVDSHAFYARST